MPLTANGHIINKAAPNFKIDERTQVDGTKDKHGQLRKQGQQHPKERNWKSLDSSGLPADDEYGAYSKRRGSLTSKYSDLRGEGGIPNDSLKYSFKQVLPRKRLEQSHQPSRHEWKCGGVSREGQSHTLEAEDTEP